MKSLFARFNMSPSRLEAVVMITLGTIFIFGLVAAGSGVYTNVTRDNSDTNTSAASGGKVGTADGGATNSGGGSSSGSSTTSNGGGAISGSGTTTSDGSTTSDGGGTASGSSATNSDGSSTAPSTTTAVRTVTISMVVHRGRGDFSDVGKQPFHGVCQPDGIRRQHEGGEPLWEEERGAVEFDKPLRLTFEVPADQQVWCAFYLQPHSHWERVTDVGAVVNGTSHAATNAECLIPAPGESYKRTVEASQYLPGRSDGCDVSYTVSN